jgi:hypothetical protein
MPSTRRATRFVFVLNKPNRELSIMNAIKHEMAALDPTVDVKILPFDSRFMEAAVAHRPDAILTYPMTGVGLSSPYYVLKHLFGSKIFCFRAEGIIDPGNPQSVSNHVGFDRYGPGLVDYEVFWGPGPAKLIGDALLRLGKLSSPQRIMCFGYPRLERYFGVTPPDGFLPLSQAIERKLATYGKGCTILFATGFHFANYTRETIFAARDLDAENRCDELLGIIEEVKRFRASWVEGVSQAARENPDILFVLKKHPIESRQDYVQLEQLDNILYVWQDVDIADLIERAALFFHYGSTSLADAYLARVPAIYLYSAEARCRKWFSDMGWPSARSVSSDRITQIVSDFRAGLIVHDPHDPRVKSILDYNFNIRDGEPYRPSQAVARLLLEHDEPAQSVALDPHMWRAVAHHYYLRTRRLIGPPMKRALRAMRAHF